MLLEWRRRRRTNGGSRCCATGERCLSRRVAFELLLLLVTKRERAMSKQQLHQRLCPSTVVVETNLANLIAEI
jgi:hypothetical protein